MKTYLINHLSIPADARNAGGLDYLETVEATVEPLGCKWLAQGPGEVIEGVWPGSSCSLSSPTVPPCGPRTIPSPIGRARRCAPTTPSPTSSS